MYKESWLDFFLINILTILVLYLFLAGSGCGTGIGNCFLFFPCSGETEIGNMQGNPVPSDLAGFDEVDSLNFDAPIEEYFQDVAAKQGTGVNCGAYTQDSAEGSVASGRQCVEDALDECREASYLLDETLEDGGRFVSFVAVDEIADTPGTCELNVHTVSNVEGLFVGDSTKSCSSIKAGETPELACGLTEESAAN